MNKVLCFLIGLGGSAIIYGVCMAAGYFVFPNRWKKDRVDWFVGVPLFGALFLSTVFFMAMVSYFLGCDIRSHL